MSEMGLSSMAVKRCFVVSVVILVHEQYDDRIIFEETWGRGARIDAMGTTIGRFSCILVSLHGFDLPCILTTSETSACFQGYICISRQR